jgi:hypothetical protein
VASVSPTKFDLAAAAELVAAVGAG